jgi:DNA repair protein RAD57
MCDIPTILPSFSTATFSHLLPALDRSGVTISDLICSEPLDLARRTLLPPDEITRLTDALIKALQQDAKCEAGLPEWRGISCLDPLLDQTLGGGFPVGYMSEVTGERFVIQALCRTCLTENSGAGKTQFLLTLMLAVQLPPPHGLSKSATYISTEAALSTSRLSQLLKTHPFLQSLPEDAPKPSLSRIHSIQTKDLESQDHILRYQVPVAIERFNVGLVIIDSIAANYRAELHEESLTPARNVHRNTAVNGIGMAERRTLLVSLGSHLRRLAHEKGVAIVVSNQVADRFTPEAQLLSPQNTPGVNDPSTPATVPLLTTLDHQQRFFTGWGDYDGIEDPFLSNPAHWKTPALGLVWANQISGRIALIREPLSHNLALADRTSNGENDGRGGPGRRRRFLRVVFASWAGATSGNKRGVEFEITGAGVRGISEEKDEGDAEKG